MSATWVLVEHVDGVGAAGKKRKKKDDGGEKVGYEWIHTVLNGRR